MPELPEVENVTRSLLQIGLRGQEFREVKLRAKSLRTPLRRTLIQNLPGEKLLGIQRRAKFILFSTERFSLVNHLGMTGSWRVRRNGEELGKHDHVIFAFRSGLELVYNDPRRFGLLEMVDRAQTFKHPWLKSLGVEPFDDVFDGEFLFKASRHVKAPIKNFIMDQRRLVGVGNIYASEALFLSGIKPSRPAGRLKLEEAVSLASAIRDILKRAIESGGSTIRDYRNSHGESGRFQDLFQVYGRTDEPCVNCKSPIRSKFLAGRNTYWCVKCQR
jgi:formamidopyrimidine-DNA glycosylase